MKFAPGDKVLVKQDIFNDLPEYFVSKILDASDARFPPFEDEFAYQISMEIRGIHFTLWFSEEELRHYEDLSDLEKAMYE